MTVPLSSAAYDVDGFEAAIELFYEKGWTDGLPIVPPTETNVARMVEASGRAPGDIVGDYPTRRRKIRVGKVAINAVMAGCRPEYFPVVLAIIEAIADPDFGIHTVNSTTGGSAVGFIVNGPVRTRLGMNVRGNILGPGNRPNSTIGRAVRLTQINVMGSISGAGNDAGEGRPILDRSTIGQPGKYAGYHIPENEEDYPSMTPLHVERGYNPAQSVVTVFATAGHIQISAHSEHSAEQIAETIAHYTVGSGKLGSRWCVLVLPPENVDYFVRDGWSKRDIRQAVHEKTRRSVAWAREQGHVATGGIIDARGGAVLPGDREKTVAVGKDPEDIYIVVAGGPAGGFIDFLTPYGGPPVSKVIRD